ncbi:MAG: response regulator [Kiritimatiellae bacterium]|jgi:CheY-like chemotaxis protein|nr:response regulator [Kiritimatiellia bacterium]
MSRNDNHLNDAAELRGHETVLLVEDEPSILAIGKRMLESLGYRVLTAGRPEEAIALAEKLASEIHLLLTDVIMPRMNGMDLATRLSLGRPGLKYMFMSGYTADIISKQGIVKEGVLFIQKPFTIEDLAAKVREALEASKPRAEVFRKDDTTLFPPDEIASSLVHDLNQPLTGILGNAQAAQNLLKREIPDLEETQNILADIVEDVKRAGIVVNQIHRVLKRTTAGSERRTTQMGAQR